MLTGSPCSPGDSDVIQCWNTRAAWLWKARGNVKTIRQHLHMVVWLSVPSETYMPSNLAPRGDVLPDPDLVGTVQGCLYQRICHSTYAAQLRNGGLAVGVLQYWGK